MNRISYLLLIFVMLWNHTVQGQIKGLHIAESGKQEMVVPFEYINNFIVVNVMFNRFLPLKFIFDTGAEYTILNKREVAEVMGLVYEKEFKVLGSDMSTELVAYLTRGNLLTMGGMEASEADLLVLEEDYFRFEEFAGIEVHGIMGANFFKHLVVNINYQDRTLTFQYPEKKLSSKQLRHFRQVPIEIKKNKVYVHSHVQINPDTLLQLSLLLDSGAGITTLLHTHSHPDLKLPEHIIEGNLAMGLGGYLKGYLGRIHRLELGTYSFENCLTNFQEIHSEQDTSMLYGRHGILGNLLLSRFNLIIDYPREKLYLRPVKRYNKGFKFDKSGLGIIATGKNLRDYKINYIIKDSPAGRAGLQPGDVITKVNIFGSSFLSLADITRILQSRDGRKIRLRIIRNGEKKKVVFRLRTLI